MRNKRHPRGMIAGNRRKSKLNYTPLIFLLCLSIGCGYAAAKYVVEPAVNYLPQLAEKVSEQETDGEKSGENAANEAGSEVVEDEVKVENTGTIKGYALQYGCYSSKEAAQKAMSGISASGLQILEQNAMYKIVGEVYETKDEARSALEKVPDGTKAFVTEIYE